MIEEKSVAWYLEQAKKAREERPDGWVQMQRVLAMHVEDILSGECNDSLILDVEKVRKRGTNPWAPKKGVKVI
jgi:hypothetical protein|tara:strand:- start:373 stop:591 length:219 start_codon:yes stop_codon:yes gene_type:complete